jgi:hypothetical protein
VLVASTFEIPESHCLNCGRALTRISDLRSQAVPVPGSLVVCIYCSSVMAVADDLSMRGMTDDEIDQLLADEETVGDLREMVARVRFAKASAN